MLDEFGYPEPDPKKRPANKVWEERYSQDSYLFGKEPVMLLKTYVDLLKKGKTLDVAMGEGRNAAFLAKNGFEVLGLDCSKSAVEKASRLAQEKGVEFEAKCQNLDFYLMKVLHFDTIVMTYFRPLKRFFNEIRKALTVGGTFLLEAYTVDHYKEHQGKNKILDFEECYQPNEVLHHLKDLRVLYYRELKEGDSHLVQCIAQKHRK